MITNVLWKEGILNHIHNDSQEKEIVQNFQNKGLEMA